MVIAGRGRCSERGACVRACVPIVYTASLGEMGGISTLARPLLFRLFGPPYPFKLCISGLLHSYFPRISRVRGAPRQQREGREASYVKPGKTGWPREGNRTGTLLRSHVA